MRIRLLFILFAFFCFIRPAAAADVIGTIMQVDGSATISANGGTAIPAKVEDTIGVNDIVASGPKSKVFILLIDDTQITLAENSRFKATEYQFDDADTSQNKARYSFLSGAFQYFSGLMTKKKDPDVVITAPYGSIGIRGTQLWTGNLDDADGGGYGLHVDEGLVDVSNTGGKVSLTAGQGTSIGSSRLAPGKPAAWSRARRQRIMDRVMLKDPGALAQRMASHRATQIKLRASYREGMQQRRAKMNNGNGNGGKLQQYLQQHPQNNTVTPQPAAPTPNRLQKLDDNSTDDDDTKQRRRRWLRNR